MHFSYFFISKKFSFFNNNHAQGSFKTRYENLFRIGKSLLEELLKEGETIPFIYKEMFLLMKESQYFLKIVEDSLVRSKSNFVIKEEDLNNIKNSLSFLIKKCYEKNFQYRTVQLLVLSIWIDIILNLSQEKIYQFREEIFAYIQLLFTD